MCQKGKNSRFRLVHLASLVGLLSLTFASTSKADVAAFNYDPITDQIDFATFSVDFAAMTAHRFVGEFEVNMTSLIDLSTGLAN